VALISPENRHFSIPCTYNNAYNFIHVHINVKNMSIFLQIDLSDENIINVYHLPYNVSPIL